MITLYSTVLTSRECLPVAGSWRPLTALLSKRLRAARAAPGRCSRIRQSLRTVAEQKEIITLRAGDWGGVEQGGIPRCDSVCCDAKWDEMRWDAVKMKTSWSYAVAPHAMIRCDVVNVSRQCCSRCEKESKVTLPCMRVTYRHILQTISNSTPLHSTLHAHWNLSILYYSILVYDSNISTAHVSVWESASVQCDAHKSVRS